jgi:hypothetical protein
MAAYPARLSVMVTRKNIRTSITLGKAFGRQEPE